MQAMYTTLAFSVPAFFLSLAGIIIALVRWKRHPIVSLMALLAFSLMAFSRIASTTLVASQVWSAQHGGSTSLPPALMNGIQGLLLVLGLFAQVLLLFAVFGWRSSRLQPPAPG